LATTQLFVHVVQDYNARDVATLLGHVKYVGQRLMASQPRELAVGNIVRRVLGLIREVSSNSDEEEEMTKSDWSSTVDPQEDHARRPELNTTISMFSPLKHGATEPADVIMTGEAHDVPPTRPQRPQFAQQTSIYSSFAVASTRSATNLFGFFGEGNSPRFSPSSSPVPAVSSPRRGESPTLSRANILNQASHALQKVDESHALKDIKLDFAEGMKELLDELELASEQISESALNYINANDVILAQGGSETIHSFLAAAASKKRKFTVFCVEGEPNHAEVTRGMILTGSRIKSEEDEDVKAPVDYKPLIAMGVNVVLVPDSAVFAIMSSVNKVLLAPHTVLANGGLIANAGACAIAAAANAHKVPVLALSGVYKLSPLYPLDTDELREIGGAGAIAGTEGGWDGVDIMNPMWDYVAPDKVHLFITNL
jgi:translation initiation factor eIF-2B subunit beta